MTACMYKNSSTPSNNTTLWHYLGTKHLDFRHENKSTPGLLIEEIQYLYVLIYLTSCLIIQNQYKCFEDYVIVSMSTNYIPACILTNTI